MSRSLLDELPGLAARLNQARRVLVMLDYDGTLTPIVAHPDSAVPTVEVKSLLGALAARPGVVLAILSGRALKDVRARVGVGGLIYAGNHGLEIDGPGIHFIEPSAAASVSALRALTDELEVVLANIPGVFVENKYLSASVHVRQVPEHRRGEVRRALDALLEPQDGCFRLTTGHAVFEIRPQAPWNKGTAALWIRDHCAAEASVIFVVGDDRTDEDAFRALPDAVTVKVGDDTDTAARYRLTSPAEVTAFLQWMLREANSGTDGPCSLCHDPFDRDAARDHPNERRR
jgi:trehalose 6-phosphate phosphatase